MQLTVPTEEQPKWHVTPSGKVKECSASTRKCRYRDYTNYYDALHESNTNPIYAPKNRCGYCETQKQNTHPIPRLEGGNYRRAPRQYPGHICEECVVELVEGFVLDENKKLYPNQYGIERYDVMNLLYIYTTIKYGDSDLLRYSK